MKKCQEIQELINRHMDTGEDKPLSSETDNHIGECTECRNHYQAITLMNDGIQSMDAEAEAVADSIKWDLVSATINREITQKRYTPRKSMSINFSNWKILVPTMTMVLLVGIAIGNFFTSTTTPPENIIPNIAAQDSYNRMESTMARREVLDYLKQSQFLMSDLMKQCSLNENTSSQYMLDKKMVRHMLNKNRYFNDHLNDSRLQNARRIIQKIRWLLFELSLLEGEIDCTDMMKLQNYIQQEKLLFKTHLVEDEIQFKESSEV